jgi:tetratricopeptide (TPR) repeat protein
MSTATPVEAFAHAMVSTELEPLERAVLVALAELSCSPWKFDLLWDLWPQLQPRRERFPDLARRLLRDDLGELIACSATSFDDLTILADIVGDPDSIGSRSREACRAAYLTIRPMVSRLEADALPRLPFSVTESEYRQRLFFVASTLQPALLDRVVGVLEETARRYEERGKREGGILCRQNIEVLRACRDAGLLEAGPGALSQQTLQFLFSVQSAALFSEVMLQWHPLFGAEFRRALVPASAADAEAAEAVLELNRSFDRVAPFAWLHESYPGAGSVLVSLCYVRLSSQLRAPFSVTLFSPDVLASCLERIESLRREWKGDLRVPSKELDALTDLFVSSGHDARKLAFGARAKDSSGKAELAEAAMLQLQVTAKAARRARNEWSEDTYSRELYGLRDQVKANPVVIDLLTHLASMIHEEQPVFAAAILEAARILAPLTGNPNVVNSVIETARRTPEEDARAAERFLSIGRPDMAILAMHNAGAALMNAGRHEDALKPLESASDLLNEIRAGRLRVPTSAVFDLDDLTRRIAGVRAKTLARLGRDEEFLQVIVNALAETGEDIAPEFSLTGGKADAVPNLHLLKSDALDRLGRSDEALQAAERARELALRAGLEDVAALSHLKIATFAYRAGRHAERLARLRDAQRLANRHRRSFPFEGEKIQAFEPLQLAFAWAGEQFIEDGQTWEALAAFEGLRSRALLDLLGLSSRIAMPLALERGLQEEGAYKLKHLREIALPGEGDPFYGHPAQWVRSIATFDEWRDRVSGVDGSYAAVVGGSAMNPADIREWAAAVERPTAVMFWFLGERYSYQAVLLASPGTPPGPPEFRKLDVTYHELHDAANAWQRSVRGRVDPPSGLMEYLSERLLAPVADLLRGAEVVYVCPSQHLHALPIASLALDDDPLNTIAEVATVPTLSVLRALQTLKRASISNSTSFVYGPEFDDLTTPVATIVGTRIESTLFSSDTHEPSQSLRDCRLLHLACHGYHDPDDPWNSGFAFSSRDPEMRLAGRTLSGWRLAADLVVLQACDTRRQVTSAAEDGFGLGRFFQLAGVPTMLLADWEIRHDVSTTFMTAFYEHLRAALAKPGPLRGYGAAYREAMRAVRDSVGAERPFLWAPFSLHGVLD